MADQNPHLGSPKGANLLTLPPELIGMICSQTLFYKSPDSSHPSRRFNGVLDLRQVCRSLYQSTMFPFIYYYIQRQHHRFKSDISLFLEYDTTFFNLFPTEIAVLLRLAQIPMIRDRIVCLHFFTWPGTNVQRGQHFLKHPDGTSLRRRSDPNLLYLRLLEEDDTATLVHVLTEAFKHLRKASRLERIRIDLTCSHQRKIFLPVLRDSNLKHVPLSIRVPTHCEPDDTDWDYDLLSWRCNKPSWLKEVQFYDNCERSKHCGLPPERINSMVQSLTFVKFLGVEGCMGGSLRFRHIDDPQPLCFERVLSAIWPTVFPNIVTLEIGWLRLDASHLREFLRHHVDTLRKFRAKHVELCPGSWKMIIQELIQVKDLSWVCLQRLYQKEPSERYGHEQVDIYAEMEDNLVNVEGEKVKPYLMKLFTRFYTREVSFPRAY